MTAKEELIKRAWKEAKEKNRDKSGNYTSVNAAEALEWLADHYLKTFINAT